MKKLLIVFCLLYYSTYPALAGEQPIQHERAITQQALSELHKGEVAKPTEKNEENGIPTLELTTANKITVNNLVKKAFKALEENDYESFAKLFNSKDYRCEISDGEKDSPLSVENFKILRAKIMDKKGIQFEYSDDAVPVRGIMKTQVEALDYYGSSVDGQYGIRMYCLFALRDGEIKIVRLLPDFVEKKVLDNFQKIIEKELVALEQLDYNTFDSYFHKNRYPEGEFNALGAAIKTDCGQNPLLKRKMFGNNKTGEIFVDFTVEYPNQQAFAMRVTGIFNEEKQIVLTNLDVDYTPAAYMEKIDQLAEMNLVAFFNTSDFAKMRSTFAPEMLNLVTTKQIKELKNNTIFKFYDKHYLNKIYFSKQVSQTFQVDANSKSALPIKTKVFVYRITTDKDSLICTLLVNGDYASPRLLGFNLSYPVQMQRIGNLNDLK